MNRTWHILGCGAIGGMLACRWQRAGVDVRIIPRENDHRAGRSLCFESQEDKRIHDIRHDRRDVIRHLILTTKAQQGMDALQGISARLAPDLTLVVMQNGLGMHDPLLEYLEPFCPALQMLVASTTEGANRPSSDHIRHAGAGTTALGPWRPVDESAVDAVANDIARAGLMVIVDGNIRQRLWDKLVMNCAINPLTALLDCRNGDLLDLPGIPAIMDRVVQEVVAVMLAQGLAADVDEQCAKTRRVAQTTAANVSSMCTDYRSGQDTEIHFINAEVVRRGEALGVPTPVNALLTRAIVDQTPWRELVLRLA